MCSIARALFVCPTCCLSEICCEDQPRLAAPVIRHPSSVIRHPSSVTSHQSHSGYHLPGFVGTPPSSDVGCWLLFLSVSVFAADRCHIYSPPYPPQFALSCAIVLLSHMFYIIFTDTHARGWCPARRAGFGSLAPRRALPLGAVVARSRCAQSAPHAAAQPDLGLSLAAAGPCDGPLHTARALQRPLSCARARETSPREPQPPCRYRPRVRRPPSACAPPPPPPCR